MVKRWKGGKVKRKKTKHGAPTVAILDSRLHGNDTITLKHRVSFALLKLKETFKMKVIFKYAVQTYSGEIDKMVYGSYRKGELCLGRKFVYPTLNDHHHSFGAVGANLADLFANISPTYAQDMKLYTTLNGNQNERKDKVLPGPYALFVKMMRAWAKSDPEHVDLATITLADIIALDANVRTIKRAIAAKYLKKVKGGDALTAGIQ